MATTPRWLVALIGAIACLLAGIGALLLGQDGNWDLRNYHWYNAYAFLNDRLAIDVAPATYYNPLLDVPYYAVANLLSARGSTFLLAALQGGNVVLLYLLARRLCGAWGSAGALLIAVVAFTGGGQLGLLGTTFYDNVVSLPILAALLIAIRALDAPSLPTSCRGFALAGLLVGAAIGLKLPTAVYGVGFVAACLLTSRSLQPAIARTASFGTAAAFALVLFSGFWMWRMWIAFHNPIYPYFNDLFGAEFGLSASYRDERFIPDSWREALRFPFSLTHDPLQVGEVQFADWRVSTFFVVLIVTGVLAAMRRREASSPRSAGLAFATIVLVVSFVVWESIFAVYRYVVTLEMLSPVLGAAWIARWRIDPRARIVAALSCGVLLVATTRVADWGRIAWGERVVAVDVPAIARPDETLALIVGFEPSSWVIPSFPGAVSFVRLQGYSHDPNDGNVGLAALARRRLAAHDGDMFLLYSKNERELATRVAAAYGLTVHFRDCARVRGNLAEGLRWCPVRRKVSP